LLPGEHIVTVSQRTQPGRTASAAIPTHEFPFRELI
jgi:hypothetical protein